MIGSGVRARPTGQYASEMTGAGAWPETDESLFTDRASSLGGVLSQAAKAREGWQTNQASIFNGVHVWAGEGASKAGAVVEKHASEMISHEQRMRDAISWCEKAAESITTAKDVICDNVAKGQEEIRQLEREAANQDIDATNAIQSVVNRKYFENFDTVNKLAVGLGGKPGVPQAPFEEPDELDTDGSRVPDGQRPSFFVRPTSSEVPQAPVVGEPVAPPIGTPSIQPGASKGVRAAGTPDMGGPVVGQPAANPVVKPDVVRPAGRPNIDAPSASPSPGRSPAGPQSQPSPVMASGGSGMPPITSSSPGSPLGSGGSSGGGAPSLGGGSGSGGGGASGVGSSGGSSGGGTSSSPISDGPSSIGDQSSVDPSNGASGPSSGAGGQPPIQSPPIADRLSNIGPAMQPASAPMAAPAAPTEVAPPAAPAPSNPTTSTAAHAPVAPVSPPATGGGVPMAGGPAMPPPPMPLGPPPTPSPAAPVVPTSAVPPPVAAPTSSAGSVVGAPAPVPVSAARAERDAIAGSMRRQSAGDPVQVARRVAAALNAVESMDFGFFWATGVTKDGTILVANSYGIGYIPDGVKLPDGVRMVSADESIPIDERAKWATFPMLALHGWAQHHDVPLRAVVATAEQFDGFDPGAARVILTPDDIPERGDMAGRSRLEVIAPGAARQLASVDDTRLGDLLPPAPADTTPPADNSLMLWFEVMKPLMSTSAERGAAHLEAMVSYANHAQELALHRAQTATDAATQRAAIADWVYWQHVSVMSNDAIVIRQ